MSEPAIEQPAARKASPPLGSFAIGPRVLDPGRRLTSVLLISVSGRTGTPFDGQTGFASCSQLESAGDDERAAAKARLDALAAFQHESAVSILESGVAGRVAFTIEAQPDGERLSERMTRAGAIAPWRVATWIATLADAVEALRRDGLVHGGINSLTTWVDANERVRLGGFLPVATVDTDQSRLAALAFELLSGKPWTPSSVAQTGTELVDSVRREGPGLSELVAVVIARGLDVEPDRTFPDPGTFAAELSKAVENSAHDIALAAWDSIARHDVGLATILTQLLPSYDPDSPETALLLHRLNGATVAEKFKPTAEPVAELRSLVERLEQRRSSGHTDTSPALSEEEMLRLFGGVTINQEVNRGNPWVIFLAVVFGMIAIMTILAALALNQT